MLSLREEEEEGEIPQIAFPPSSLLARREAYTTQSEEEEEEEEEASLITLSVTARCLTHSDSDSIHARGQNAQTLPQKK